MSPKRFTVPIKNSPKNAADIFTDNNANPQNSLMKKFALILVLLLAALAGAYYFLGEKTPPTQFLTATVSRADLTQSVTATGDLQPVLTVDVSSQISGLINEVLVDYNTPVKQGDVLARIDPATYQSKLAQANAQLANTKANHQLVSLNSNRTHTLFERSLVSQQDVDQVDAQLAQADAQLLIQQASVDNAKTDLERCTIYSPIDGIVMDKLAEVGKTVAASLNAPTLFTLANDLAKMQINAAVSEADIGTVAVGQDVTFTVDAYPTRQFRGKVVQIRNNPVTVQSVVTYSTIIEVKNADLKLKPGMTASVSIISARRENTLRVPNAAVRVRIPDELLPPETAAKTETAKVDREAVNQLMREAGINPNTRRALAPADRERLIKLAEERGIRLPDRILNPKGGATAPTSKRTLYILEGTPEKPAVKPVMVTLGISDGSSTEVISGLNEGDTVITSAFQASIPKNAAPNSPFNQRIRTR